MDVRVRLYRKLSAEELMLLNCGVEKTFESPLDCKEIKPVNPKSVLNILWKDWCWIWNSNTLATWCEELTHWKRPWFGERLKAGEGDDRGWNVWMASPTQRTWFWVNLLSCWWTGKPGLLQSMGSQRVRHNWATELSGCTSSVGFLNVSSIQWHPYLRSQGLLATENLYLKDFSF